MKIGIASAIEVDAIWPTIGPQFASAVENYGDDISSGDLWRMCRSGNAFLLLVFNDDGVSLACVFRFDTWVKGAVLRILAVAGHEMNTWHDGVSDFLERIAKENGATRIVAEGRKGWERAYPRLRLLRCVYEMEIA